MSTTSRKEVVIIVLPDSKRFHFCGLGLEGDDHNTWHDYDDLFTSVEIIMQEAKIASNVTSVSELRSCGNSIDHLVKFNTWNGNIEYRIGLLLREIHRDSSDEFIKTLTLHLRGCISQRELARSISEAKAIEIINALNNLDAVINTK